MPSTDCPIEFRLELTNERFQPYKWAIYERSTGNQLAYSENHTSRSGAVDAVHVVQAGRVSYSVFSSVGNDNVDVVVLPHQGPERRDHGAQLVQVPGQGKRRGGEGARAPERRGRPLLRLHEGGVVDPISRCGLESSAALR